ncbi:MAG: DUF998 domain-containing protein [Ilumatobacteraceae bacterium]
MTEILLVVGVTGAVLFVVVLLVEGARRPGYESTYHPGSALSLGDRGSIQIANFVLLGVAMLAFAVGVYRTLDTEVGALLLAIFGLAMIAAGAFVMDPMRGYPPGTPSDTPTELTWHAQVHEVTGPVAFLALFGACLALAARLDGPWRLYTVLTASAGLVLTIGTALAWRKDAAHTGLIQRGLIVVYFSWIVVLGIHLAR